MRLANADVFFQEPTKTQADCEEVLQNFELLTTTGFRIRKGLSRGCRHRTTEESQEHGSAKKALKGAKSTGHVTILDQLKADSEHRERMTEQGLGEDDTQRRDEEPKVDQKHKTNATEKQN